MRKRFAAALLFSLGLHFALIFGFTIPVPEFSLSQPPVMSVRLQPKPPPPPPPEPKKPVPKKLKPAPKPQAMPKPVATPEPETASAEQPAPEAAPPIVAGDAPSTPSDVAPEVATPTPAPDSAKASASSLPDAVEIRYKLLYGDSNLEVGKARAVWRREADRYYLRYTAEAVGIYRMIKSASFRQTSEGVITDNGLQPVHFSIVRGDRAPDDAYFDWEGKTLKLGKEDGGKTVTLKDGTQDLLSVQYQFAMQPPQGDALHFALTDGRKVDAYDFEVRGEETLDTPMGPVATLHLHRGRPDGDQLDLWLANDYYWLPARVRKKDKNGQSIEQVVTEFLVTVQ